MPVISIDTYMVTFSDISLPVVADGFLILTRQVLFNRLRLDRPVIDCNRHWIVCSHKGRDIVGDKVIVNRFH